MSAGAPAFALRDVGRRFGETEALAPLSLRVEPGERIAIVGPSGAGKTTLLNLLAGLDTASAGTIQAEGRALERVGRRERARMVGIMHQQLNLVPSLTVVHNVLAGRLGEWSIWRALSSLVVPRDVAAVRSALAQVGISDKIHERTSQLSGGEQQRVALARLLMQDPRIVLADEPVSALDPARAASLIALLIQIARDGERTLIVSLHSVTLALEHFDRIIGLREGRVLFDRAAAAVQAADLQTLYSLGDATPLLFFEPQSPDVGLAAAPATVRTVVAQRPTPMAQ